MIRSVNGGEAGSSGVLMFKLRESSQVVLSQVVFVFMFFPFFRGLYY